MGQGTNIEWCDSTINPTSGCDGCELFQPGHQDTARCYASHLHTRRLAKSFPEKYGSRFEEVRMIPGRMQQAANWNVHDVAAPLGSVTSASERALVEPFLVEVAHGNGSERNGNQRRVRSVEAPLGAVPCTNRFALAEPFIIEMMHGNGSRVNGDAQRCQSVERPIKTVPCSNRFGLVEPFLIEMRGTEKCQVKGSARSLGKPLGAVTAGGIHHALIEPFLVHTAHGKGRGAKSVRKPLGTVCGNRGDIALCEPALLPQQSDGRLRPVSEPAPTVATDGAIALVEPLIVPRGRRYILDIRFRMLQPHELAGAQGFPAGYKFTGTKTDQVKQIGNAVPCNLSRALVKAVMGDRMKGKEGCDAA